MTCCGPFTPSFERKPPSFTWTCKLRCRGGLGGRLFAVNSFCGHSSRFPRVISCYRMVGYCPIHGDRCYWPLGGGRRRKNRSCTRHTTAHHERMLSSTLYVASPGTYSAPPAGDLPISMGRGSRGFLSRDHTQPDPSVEQTAIQVAGPRKQPAVTAVL